MKRYSRDPYWITMRYAGKCAGCGVAIRKGYQAYYYPATRKMYCLGSCGQAAQADFAAHAQDEEVYNNAR